MRTLQTDSTAVPGNTRRKSGIVHVVDRNGHRAAYQDLFSDTLGLKRDVGLLNLRRIFRFLFAKRLLFGTISIEYHKYFAIAACRALMGKPTTGLFLGAMNIDPQGQSVNTKIGIGLIRITRKMRRVSMLTICPYVLTPSLRDLTDGWIFDPQLWDIVDDPMTGHAEVLAKNEVGKSSGKIVVIFVGKGSKSKGFLELVEFAKRYPDVIHVIVAGKVDDDCKSAASELTALGMHVDDRYVPEDVLQEYYSQSDFSWCVYREEYDRPSGVFGRALQAGVVPIVRKASFLERFSVEFDVPAVPFRGEQMYEGWLLRELEQVSMRRAPSADKIRARLRKMKEVSMKKISDGLGFPDRADSIERTEI